VGPSSWSASRVEGVIPAIGVAVAVVVIAFAHGGYFATEWGWALLAFTLVCVLALLVRDRIEVAPLEIAAVGALAAFAGWTALSTAWSVSAAQPLLATERTLVYAAALPAVLLVTEPRRRAPALLAGVLTAAVVICGYALATRLIPGWLTAYPPSGGYQLAEPIGYSNGLAIIAAVGALVAVGLVADVRTRRRSRALASGTLPLLLSALYFTFSRGGWVALAAGLCVAALITARRLHFLAVVVACAAAPAAALLFGSGQSPLTHESASLAAARTAGWKFGAALLLSSVAAAAVGWVLELPEQRLHIGRRLRRGLGAAIIVGLLAVVAAVLVHAGGPAGLAARVSASFDRTLPATGGDLNRRFTSFSSDNRRDYWRVAWLEVRAHPWLGGGAGSYERYWHLDRPTTYDAQNAHNLYLETLAELGPFGLLLLLVALGIPFVAAIRARAAPAVTPGAAAFAAYAVHAGIDWDFQIVAVTLSGLFCGSALLVSARDPGQAFRVPVSARICALAALIALAAVAVAIQIGNSALANGTSVLASGNAPLAQKLALRAQRWQPWSYQPLQLLGEVELALHQPSTAQQSFRRAIALDTPNWNLWYDLAQASQGSQRINALARAAQLNPRSPELAGLRSGR
jgi:hypothetical protein